MKKLQRHAVIIAILALMFFLVLSLVTSNWKFLLWSIVPIFLSLMTAFLAKANARD
ncbi:MULTISPECIES: hypothetical protein [unclassified Sporosarcina]|uniref:hypothetical protein n=1 Tax=unclassified Sporosarcina TaxID=2647733 RepID=UPI0013040948|nr:MULTISPECIES: hypothetical protein [unclassified Sporosarcina]